MRIKFIKGIKNLRLKYKILACIVFITSICLLLISLLCYNYFARSYEKEAMNNTNYTLLISGYGFKDSLNSIFSNTNKFVSSPGTCNTIRSIESNDRKPYLDNYTNLQSPLNVLIQGDSWIEAVILFGSNGDFYSTSEYGWNFDTSNLFNFETLEETGISVLPMTKNPLTNLNSIIPIIMPITTMNSSLSPVISGSAKTSKANLAIMLNVPLIDRYLQQMNNTPNSHLYLASQNGEPLNLAEDSAIYSVAMNESVKDHIADSKVVTEYKKSMLQDTYLVASYEIGICGLKIVSITSSNQLLSGIKTIKLFIYAVWGASVILAIILSFMLSTFITRPMKKLMETVQQMKDGVYETKPVPKYGDEVGKLNTALNSMYETIQYQIEAIKQEATQKTKAEINALTEQINPHFLYNTLDCIRWEILGNNKDKASKMVEHLGDFLRIGLNYGSDIIDLERELTHVENYMYIMNQRSNHKISFTYTIDDKLKTYPIMKLILQPLVENSIKHGFGCNDFTAMGIIPYIHIEIVALRDALQISINDNGSGIDIDKATNALNISTDTTAKHLGLCNIMRRLSAFYDSQITFDFYTTPYFKNSVVLTINNFFSCC